MKRIAAALFSSVVLTCVATQPASLSSYQTEQLHAEMCAGGLLAGGTKTMYDIRVSYGYTEQQVQQYVEQVLLKWLANKTYSYSQYKLWLANAPKSITRAFRYPNTLTVDEVYLAEYKKCIEMFNTPGQQW